MARRYHVLLNPGAGTAANLGLDGRALEILLSASGLDATVDANAEIPLETRISAAIASSAAVIVSAGGDGTATALATALVGTDRLLAVLPFGTANLLARDLGMPLDPAAAIGALPTLVERRIDVGEVNGTLFLHKIVIGSIPAIAAGRERIRGMRGLMPSLRFLRFAIRRIRRARRMAVEIRADGGPPRIVRANAVAVANNVYDERFARIFARERLDDGKLGLYILKRLTILDAARLAVGMLFGRWRRDEVLHLGESQAITIRSRRPLSVAMVDGELRRIAMPLSVRIRPQALRVLAVPQP